MKMPKLTASERAKLPASAFGMPTERKYPIDVPGREKGFAKSALRLRGRGKGMTSADRRRIISKSSKVLYGKTASDDAQLKKLQQGKKMNDNDRLNTYVRDR